MTNAGPDLDRVVNFYDTHPIHEAQILENIRARGVPLEELSEDVLMEHDQDHFGGLEATDILAEAAGIGSTSRVLDVCSGVGGPARYLAHRYGCRVTGIDLTASRHETAIRLTRLVKLDHLVEFHCANALAMPFADEAFDVVIGQEAWAHVPDKAGLISECVRVLRRGGRIAFTDILARTSLTPPVAERLTREMAFVSIASLDEYRSLLEQAGCEVVRCDDLSAEWTRSCSGAWRCTAACKEPPSPASARRISAAGTKATATSSACSPPAPSAAAALLPDGSCCADWRETKRRLST